MVFDVADPDPDYEFLWPRALFKSEVAAALRLSDFIWPDDAELLLEEAFAGNAPVEDLRTVTFRDVPSGSIDLSKVTLKDRDEEFRAFLNHLANSADALPERSIPRPYWAARHAAEPSPAKLQDRAEQLQRDWARLVEALRDRGYFERIARRACVDDPAPPADEVLDVETEQRLGVAGLWPLQPGQWTTEIFDSLIEVVHDLIARPGHRVSHDQCGWHYRRFSLEPARVLYRHQVDQLLARNEQNLQLAGDGEDRGHLVRRAGDDRDDLVSWAMRSPERGVRADVEHAIALFRSRTATTAERRSAVIALAGILERRRPLLKSHLFTKDEGALFHIANDFDIRHRDKSQQSDYDLVFLDWLFWWYLATVELTDRLIARQSDK